MWASVNTFVPEESFADTWVSKTFSTLTWEFGTLTSLAGVVEQLWPPGVIANPGRQKRRTEPLLTEFVLNLYVFISLALLHCCPFFYHVNFVEEEAENLTFTVK